MTNLDDLAKLAPFQIVKDWVGSYSFFVPGGPYIEPDDALAALNEWAALRKDLWSSVPGLQAIMQRQAEMEQEVGELRAYRERTDALVKAAGELWACLQSSKDCGEIFVPKRLAVFMQRFAATLDAGDPAPKEASDGN